MNEAGGASAPTASTVRIRQAYLAFATSFAVVLLVIAATSLLIGLRQWLLPSSGDDFGGSFFGPETEGADAAVRSVLGTVALALPAAAILLWHRREAGRAMPPGPDAPTWGRSLSLHLVAGVTLAIAGVATVTMLQSLRDAIVPQCFPSFSGGPISVPPMPDETFTPPPLTTVEPPISIPIDPGFAPEPECYPQTGDALRNALDAGLVAGVAGGTWAWHLARTRGPRRRGPAVGEPAPAED